MFYTNKYGDLCTDSVKDLIGAKVVNSGSGIELPDGRHVVFGGIINPEDGSTREFIECDEEGNWGDSIKLPLAY